MDSYWQMIKGTWEMMCWMKNIFIVLRIETLDVVWTKQLKHHTHQP